MEQSTNKKTWLQAMTESRERRKWEGSPPPPGAQFEAADIRKAADQALQAELNKEAFKALRFIGVLGIVAVTVAGFVFVGWPMLIPLGIGAVWGLMR